MPVIQIRDASDGDLPGILSVLAESGIDGGGSSFRLLVALVDGEIAGTYSLVILEKLGKRGARSGVVEDVGVPPQRQGRGIGRAMMAHAIEECRRAGCYKLALSSNVKREGAHRFYESLGFERHGYSFAVFL
jgi:GNAT superfamily N-acetyltransferase